MYGCEHTCVLIHLVCFCKQREDNGYFHALAVHSNLHKSTIICCQRWLTFCRQPVSKILADVHKLQDASPHRPHAVIRVHRDLGPLSGGGQFTQRREALRPGRHAGYLFVRHFSLQRPWAGEDIFFFLMIHFVSLI